MHAAILSYNHPQLTKRAVNSALKFFEPKNIHLVHNGSVAENINDLKKIFPKIHHHELLENKGFSGGVNLALFAAFQLSNWCLFLTNDCVLESCPSEFKNLAPGLYAPLILRRNTSMIDSRGGFFDVSSARLIHWQSQDTPLENKNLKPYVPGTAFLLDQQSFIKIGCFDEGLGTYWEDVDFSLRAHSAKINIGNIDQIQIRHGIGKTCHKDPHYTNYLFHRNRYRVSRRYGTPGIKLFFDFTKRISSQIIKSDWNRARQSLKAYIER